MGGSVQTSIIIPVYNQWALTCDCLRSLAATAPAESCEVIVVDNASSDATPSACPALGRELFGDRFVYRREEVNRNFGPAVNIGARLARADYLFLLNNDTVAEPGWYGPLLEDFTRFPDLACTGPLLVYPPSEPFGETVQHLGVHITLLGDAAHLYEGIPAASPLARQRRFFQVITAAAMLLPRTLFLDNNGFDEDFRNGFEDVELCARLGSLGLRMSVNPESRIRHLTSRSAGRHDHAEENFRLLLHKCPHALQPDWHVHLARDGFGIGLNDWLQVYPLMDAAISKRLSALLLLNGPEARREALLETLALHPFWIDGYTCLTSLFQQADMPDKAFGTLQTLTKMVDSPDYLFPFLNCAQQQGDRGGAAFAISRLFRLVRCFEEQEQMARTFQTLARTLPSAELENAVAAWLLRKETFRYETYHPFLRQCLNLGLLKGAPPSGNAGEIWKRKLYALWHELEDNPRLRAKERGPVPEGLETRARFSVLVPVYNPKAKHLRAAVESMLAQEWPHWELCLADDASTDPAVRPLLEELAALDPRIRVEFRAENGNISAASNTALSMARYPYCALLDQDDVLTSDALLEVALVIAANPDAALIYSDEDKLEEDGLLNYPYFKTDWDPVLLEAQNMVSHLGVYATGRMRAIGGFRSDFDGSQDYDLVWRFTEGLETRCIVHIPKVLYHWRVHSGSVGARSIVEKSTTVLVNFRNALQEHVQRTGRAGKACITPNTTYFRVVYDLPEPLPLVSLLVDLRQETALGRHLIPLWLDSAGYEHCEIVVGIGPKPVPAEKAQALAGLDPRVRVVYLPEAGWPERLNALAAEARGAVLGFLGKGLRPVEPGWMRELASRVFLDGVGVAGGKLLSEDERIVHCGFSVDARGRLFALHQGQEVRRGGYFCWTVLARTVPAVDRRCLFTRRELFMDVGGFAAEDPTLSGILYCLELGRLGMATVFTPYACFLLGPGSDYAASERQAVATGVQTPVTLPDGRALRPCTPNLAMSTTTWLPCFHDRE